MDVNEDFDFDMPTDGFDPYKVGGTAKLFPGGYLMEVTKLSLGDKGEIVVHAEIISGTVQGTAGNEWKCYFQKEYGEWPQRKAYAFALATGMISQKEFDEFKSSGVDAKLKFTKSVGRPFCVELEFGRDQYADRIGLKFDHFWHPCDKRANFIPVNVKKLASYNPPIVLPAGRNPDGISVKAGPTRSAPTKPNAASQAANVDEMAF